MACAPRQESGFPLGFDWFSIELHAIRASQAESPAPSGAGLRLRLLMAGGLP
jgi:hypothetical protein